MFLGAALSHHLTVPIVLATMEFYQLAMGLVMPNGTTGAIDCHPRATGFASAFLGFSHVTVGMLESLAVARFADPERWRRAWRGVQPKGEIAGVMSVRAKSLPLNNSGKSRALASA